MMLGKAVLGISALAFIGYGLLSLVSPAIPAGFAGLQMSNGDAFAEVGSMYGGLQTGIGLFCALALFKPEFYRPGLMLLVLAIGALTFARLLSLLAAPDPVSVYSYGALGYELVTTLIALTALLKK
tara:strand:- start:33989 stop:34366 length:378 start_codon:yes stop_codon:yes gene_type:complete